MWHGSFPLSGRFSCKLCCLIGGCNADVLKAHALRARVRRACPKSLFWASPGCTGRANDTQDSGRGVIPHGTLSFLLFSQVLQDGSGKERGMRKTRWFSLTLIILLASACGSAKTPTISIPFFSSKPKTAPILAKRMEFSRFELDWDGMTPLASRPKEEVRQKLLTSIESIANIQYNAIKLTVGHSTFIY